MKRIVSLIILFSLSLIRLNAQALKITHLKGQIFISDKLDYLQFITDTSVCSSFRLYEDTAISTYFRDTAVFKILNDSLVIQQKYVYPCGPGKYDPYKINYLSPDSLSLNIKEDFRGQTEPVRFINLKYLKEDIFDFQYLKLYSSGTWSGQRQITIDKTGNVSVIPLTYGSPVTEIKAKLSKREFAHFKKLMSYSLISKLPLTRDCINDDTRFNFEVSIGNKLYISKGCKLSKIHRILLHYIYSLDANKGLLR